MPAALNILERLISFDTTSRNSNMELVAYICALLAEHGINYDYVDDDQGMKRAVVATLPAHDGKIAGGIALSAHTDVVPVDGQPWTKPPFMMTAEDGKVFGRGTTDMKGFVAVALKTLLDAKDTPLTQPLHLALSYDEEVGCKGIKPLLDLMKAKGRLPELALIGEPSELAPVGEHKGKIALDCYVKGDAGHSAFAAKKVNAVMEAARLITYIGALSVQIPQREQPDDAYAAPNSSLHVGPIRGGEALNMIPESCHFQFEVRFRPGFDAAGLIDEIKRYAHDVLEPAMQARSPKTGFSWQPLIDYPAFRTKENSKALALASRPSGVSSIGKDDYGTEAGVFQDYAGVDAIVIGPGSMAQGHQPDEFIEHEQLTEAEKLLAHLVDDLAVKAG